MKRLFTVILLTWVSAGMIHAGIVEKTYTFAPPSITSSGDYSVISFENTVNTGFPGEPSLPYLAVKLLLPPGERAESIEIICESPTVMAGTWLLYPVQASRPLSAGQSGAFLFNRDIYQSAAAYPSKQNGHLTTGYLNGYSVAMTTITPVSYHPAGGQVSWYGKITVKLTTKPDSEAVRTMENLSWAHGISGFVENPEMISLYPSPDQTADDYQLLIITPSQYENSFQGIIDLYYSRGIKTEVKSRESIVTEMPGQDVQEKIRNYIIQEYQTHNIEFVLLGGDVEHIPYRGFYCYVQSGSGYEDSDIPADLYYCSLDGNWNNDNDNRWGEPGEDDLLPEIGLARMPFSNSTDLSSMIQKSLSYQDNPVTGELRDPLLAGEHLYDNPPTWGSDYLELLIGYRTDNGYTTDGIPVDHDIDKLYEKNGSWGGSDLRARINQGRSFVHHSGHANETYVAHLSNSDITNSNFAQANGIDHNFTLLFTHGCNCGSFDFSDCILEKMVTIQNFAVSVIGNSRYGWFNEGQTEGPGAHLHREFTDALYHEKMHRLGAAFREMKIQTAPWVTAPGQWEEGALRWNFYDINILGDPALGVWTDEPVSVQAVYQSAIPIAMPSLQVTVTGSGTPMADFTCTVIKDGVMHGTARTNTSGVATITFDPIFTQLGQADLIITGYNSLPAYFPLTIIPNSGSYVIYSSHQLDDSQGGNGNGEADFGESILVDIGIENVGTQQAGNVTGTLTTTDNYITITDGEENFGNIPGGSAVNKNGAFAFDVADNVPDGHTVNFELELEAGTESWVSSFSITVNAPLLSIGSITIDDFTGGNGDGKLDPGETADILIEATNSGHCGCSNTTGILATQSPDIVINTANCNLDDLAAGQTKTAVFNISVDQNTATGTNVDLDFTLASGAYSEEKVFYLTVGMIFEDFETGDFSKFNWQSAGNAPWTITGTNPYEGAYSAKSGAIGDNQATELFVVMDVLANDSISFFRKVSSEEGYDYLEFYIDNVLKGEWAGEKSWAKVQYPVSAGMHTFKWVYNKDVYVNSGQDCAWLDFIVFPAVTNSVSPLNVTATATPAQICYGSSSQLYANVTGGTGNYTYQWSPQTGLSNPAISNPVANPLQTITYTVTVNDGNETVSGQVTVTVNPTPETPIINQQDNYLYSSASEGNQWYDSNGPVNGATGQVFYPQLTDNYHVVVTNSFGCESNPSNVIYYLVTGLDEFQETSIRVYPNPASGEIHIDCSGRSEIIVINILNEVVFRKTMENNNGRITIDLSGYAKGLYFIRVITGDGEKTGRVIMK
ncbi:MAG: T9SS type A sorting domain-containing protein [Bacteroidales bacterium]|nr:T9SS type A sorting domain-containing protein [Bacteroidales bacterium]